MEGWCGMPPWIAPELGSRNGPIQWYSPILADQWACGWMIEYFTEYFPTYEGAQKTRLQAFAQQLLYVIPRARSELNQLQAIHGPQKQKHKSIVWGAPGRSQKKETTSCLLAHCSSPLRLRAGIWCHTRETDLRLMPNAVICGINEL